MFCQQISPNWLSQQVYGLFQAGARFLSGSSACGNVTEIILAKQESKRDRGRKLDLRFSDGQLSDYPWPIYGYLSLTYNTDCVESVQRIDV